MNKLPRSQPGNLEFKFLSFSIKKILNQTSRSIRNYTSLTQSNQNQKKNHTHLQQTTHNTTIIYRKHIIQENYSSEITKALFFFKNLALKLFSSTSILLETSLKLASRNVTCTWWAQYSFWVLSSTKTHK